MLVAGDGAARNYPA